MSILILLNSVSVKGRKTKGDLRISLLLASWYSGQEEQYSLTASCIPDQ